MHPRSPFTSCTQLTAGDAGSPEPAAAAAAAEHFAATPSGAPARTHQPITCTHAHHARHAHNNPQETQALQNQQVQQQQQQSTAQQLLVARLLAQINSDPRGAALLAAMNPAQKAAFLQKRLQQYQEQQAKAQLAQLQGHVGSPSPTPAQLHTISQQRGMLCTLVFLFRAQLHIISEQRGTSLPAMAFACLPRLRVFRSRGALFFRECPKHCLSPW